MSQWLDNLKATIRRFAKGRAAPRPRRSTRLGLEALEERALMSSGPLGPALRLPPVLRTPLTWTAPSNNGTNDVSLQIVGGAVEVFDNGRLVASKPLFRTSSVTLTGGLNTVNDFEIDSTAAGVPTMINLRTGHDWVFLGGKTGSVQGLKGALSIRGVGGHSGVDVYNTADTGPHTATIGSTGITGLAPATIQYKGVSAVDVYGGTGPDSSYTITGSPGDLYFEDHGTLDSVVINSTSGRVLAASYAQDWVTFNGPSSGTNTFTGNPTSERLAGKGYANTAYYFPLVTANSHSAGDVANLDGASTGVNQFSGNPVNSLLFGQGYWILVNQFATVNATSHSSGDAANLDGAIFGSNVFIAAVDVPVGGDPATGPYISRASMSSSSYHINTSGFANVTGTSHSALDWALVGDVNHNYSTDAQGNVFINDHGFTVAAMGFPAGSVTTD
jgi:hypothetical protein